MQVLWAADTWPDNGVVKAGALQSLFCALLPEKHAPAPQARTACKTPTSTIDSHLNIGHANF